MRRLIVMGILAMTLGLYPGCAPGEQPDDVAITPGGSAYRANVHQVGVKDRWPEIQQSTVVLADNVTITYRADIETKAGEIRNNLIFMRIAGRHDLKTSDLSLSTSNLPAGMSVKEDAAGGLPGNIAKLLIIEVSKDVKPGEYTFEINVEFEGKDYGQIPCTIKVVS
ncbi:MAG: hypothetical protein Q8Q07_08400 [Dehalococcoidales bacterium]|nr:hypothetical protein [Dehalococcoidales bacterium]